MNASAASRCIGVLIGCLVGLVGCDGDAGYRRKFGGWTYDGATIAPEDERSFEPIDQRFARDAKRGYYRGRAIADSDGATFTVLSEHEARDGRAVWYCDTFRKGQEYWSIQHLRMDEVREADPPTYRALGRGYARDAHRVYADGVAFGVRDVATFEPLEARFARDAERGYFDRVEIADSDGATFASLDARYARDRSHVWFADHAPSEPNRERRPITRLMKAADVLTLRVLGRDYAVDARNVWYEGRVMRGADPASFRIDDSSVGDADADDRSGRWSRGERLVVTTQEAR